MFYPSDEIHELIPSPSPATTDKATGEIHVQQRIKVESWIKESQDKAGNTKDLTTKEQKRVEKSTKDVMLEKAREGKIKWGLPGGKH